MTILHTSRTHEPWNKDKLVDQNAPLKLKDICAIRVGLQLRSKIRDLGFIRLGN